ncbi:hypothetical protein GGI12_005054 [Dipsacomyces acuminosporus]|nr:hypothetical protein GGI12_005054 [Dipsacomyces acuminosporus]
MLFRNCRMQGLGNAADIPPAEWCATTLHSLSDKYEHLSESRKVKPPFAEAVLNSFKSKLLTLVSEQALYESDDNSDGDTDWPLISDYSHYMDMKTGADSYISASPETSNSLSNDDDGNGGELAAAKDDQVESEEDELGIISPSPSPTDMAGPSYAGADDSADSCSDGSDAVINIPVGIDEALRRILSSASSQLLSMNFSTFAMPDSSTLASADDCSNNGICSQASTQGLLVNAQDDEDDDDDEHSQALAESGSCSPSSLDSPEEPMDYTSADSDSVGVFVNNFPDWESVQRSSTCSGDSADTTATASSTAAADDAASVTASACKRKRCASSDNACAADSDTSPKLRSRNILSISPCKRSRPSACSDAAAAAVPSTNIPADVSSKPPSAAA